LLFQQNRLKKVKTRFPRLLTTTLVF